MIPPLPEITIGQLRNTFGMVRLIYEGFDEIIPVVFHLNKNVTKGYEMFKQVIWEYKQYLTLEKVLLKYQELNQGQFPIQNKDAYNLKKIQFLCFNGCNSTYVTSKFLEWMIPDVSNDVAELMVVGITTRDIDGRRRTKFKTIDHSIDATTFDELRGLHQLQINEVPDGVPVENLITARVRLGENISDMDIFFKYTDFTTKMETNGICNDPDIPVDKW